MLAGFAGAAFLVVMLVMVLLAGKGQQLFLQAVFLLHSLQQLGAGELRPGRGDNGRFFVVGAQQFHRRIQPVLTDGVGAAEDDGAGVLDLVVVKLAEVLHIQAALARVHHSDKAGKFHVRMRLRKAFLQHCTERPATGGATSWMGICRASAQFRTR